MDLKAFTCSVDGCDGPRSGVCINNLPFNECPDVIPVPENEVEGREDGTSGHSPIEMVSTPGGRSLDAAACDMLLRERGGTVIGIVAGPEVGKTTLIGTIYELIHRGRMPGFGFAGSETLRGYEERTFLARFASNRVKPDTPRTKVKEQINFTHLRLATKDGIRDVYFSDRSGEHFDIALGKPTEFATFVELERAETILLPRASRRSSAGVDAVRQSPARPVNPRLSGYAWYQNFNNGNQNNNDKECRLRVRAVRK